MAALLPHDAARQHHFWSRARTRLAPWFVESVHHSQFFTHPLNGGTRRFGQSTFQTQFSNFFAFNGFVTAIMFFCWTVFNFNCSVLYLIANKMELHVNMFRSSMLYWIFCNCNAAFVVLMQFHCTVSCLTPSSPSSCFKNIASRGQCIMPCTPPRSMREQSCFVVCCSMILLHHTSWRCILSLTFDYPYRLQNRHRHIQLIPTVCLHHT